VAAAYIERPATIDLHLLLGEADTCGTNLTALGVQAWRVEQDPANGATSESKLRPGEDRRIEVALIVDVMREPDAMRIEERISDAIRKSAKAQVPHVKSGVYRLLGVWEAGK
jgi:hypothetical protein